MFQNSLKTRTISNRGMFKNNMFYNEDIDMESIGFLEEEVEKLIDPPGPNDEEPDDIEVIKLNFNIKDYLFFKESLNKMPGKTLEDKLLTLCHTLDDTE